MAPLAIAVKPFNVGGSLVDRAKPVAQRASRKRPILSRLVLPLILAASAYLVLLLYGRFGELGAALSRFGLVYLIPVLALVLANYALRFGRWHYYLRRCGARVPWRGPRWPRRCRT